jgi:hypothetical protein
MAFSLELSVSIMATMAPAPKGLRQSPGSAFQQVSSFVLWLNPLFTIFI